MVAILVKWPGPFILTFVPSYQKGSTCNRILIGQVVSEEMMFEIVDNNNTDDGAWVYCELDGSGIRTNKQICFWQ